MAKYQKSRYTPKNPGKYVGDITNIIARSSWERRFFIWCDTQSSVLSWSSEETIIRYLCPTDGKYHRYFVDAKINIKDIDGNVQTYLIEIKPMKETKPPSTKNKKRFLSESLTYAKNLAKWEAAIKYAESRNWKFKLITEYELGLKK